MLDVTLSQILAAELAAGKELYLPLEGTSDEGDPITYSATSSDSAVTVEVVEGGRSLVINVSGIDADGQAFSGDLTFRLFEDLAPETTARIIELANSEFYEGISFHRVIDDFVAQAGDPTGTGSGGSGVEFADEFSTDVTFSSPGLLAMANSGDDTNDSQFFIVDRDLSLEDLPQHLTFNHTIFGLLTSGFDTFESLITVPTSATGVPDDDVVINSMTVIDDTQNGVLRITAPADFDSSAEITVTANDGGDSPVEQTFTVDVMADTVNDRAFLGDVSDVTTMEDTPIAFTVTGIDLENDDLTFVVRDPASFAGPNSTGTAPAMVDVDIQVVKANGDDVLFTTATILLTPTANFSGTIELIIGVRDQTNRGASQLDSRSNFDTQLITLTVESVNDAPTANSSTTNVATGDSVEIQLTGNDGDAEATQQLTYEIVSQPANGTITNFNPATGKLDYTPQTDFRGQDSFTFRIVDDGGTANGGQNTSNTATVTINVSLAPPASIELDPASDNGASNDDGVTSDSSPTLNLTAGPGLTVTVLVNGETTVNTVETSSGVYTVTLSVDTLQVGENTVSAVAADSVGMSARTDDFTFVYIPSYQEIYTVPGDVGTSQTITFNWTLRDAAYDNEFGVYPVDDTDGRVNGLLPTDPGYAAAALSQTGTQVIFHSGAHAGATATLNATGGDLFGFYIIANNSTSRFLSSNSDNGPGTRAYFSTEDANPDGVDHVQTAEADDAGELTLSWEDLYGGGDSDYNDLVVAVSASDTMSAAASLVADANADMTADENANASEALRVAGDEGTDVATVLQLASTTLDIDLTGETPPEDVIGEVGLYVVDDVSGTIDGVAPSDPDYLSAVLQSSSRQTVLNELAQVGDGTTLDLQAGDLIGFYYVADVSLQTVADQNPANEAGSSPSALFSFAAANPDGQPHFEWYGPSAESVSVPLSGFADTLELRILDELFGSDEQFGDLIISIK